MLRPSWKTQLEYSVPVAVLIVEYEGVLVKRVKKIMVGKMSLSNIQSENEFQTRAVNVVESSKERCRKKGRWKSWRVKYKQ